MKINFSNMRFKPQRGLTAREFILLALLIIALEGYLVINYILSPVYDNMSRRSKTLTGGRQYLPG